MQELPQRIASKIAKGDTPAHAPHLGACWEWTAARTNGYGKTLFDGQMRNTHRVVFMLLIRPLSTKEHLDHLCKNKGCCNPEHLEVVTPSGNALRYWDTIKTCKNGHERTPSNTLPGKGCRACAYARQNNKYATDERWREYRKVTERERHKNKPKTKNNG